jgi:glycosyltransferase involved in cell wall biosynthesis
MMISFCTTCMGRLHHLKETLPKNLETAESHADHEFVLLNYGSKDGMHEWCRENLRPHIISGRLKYFRTNAPDSFLHSHAKNIAHRRASGEIIVNLDADNYLVDGYVEFVMENLKEGRIITSPENDIDGVPGCFGKIALFKEQFYSVNGYEEDIEMGWAWEDNHLINRIIWQNDINPIKAPRELCRTISHGDDERLSNCNGNGRDILAGKESTWAMLMESRKKQSYIANVGRRWGHASDLSSDLL